MKFIESKSLLSMYKKGFFPMAENQKSEKVNFFKPNLRFIIPIKNFHIPKKLFKFYKKKIFT